jgi:hypothetical protein
MYKTQLGIHVDVAVTLTRPQIVENAVQRPKARLKKDVVLAA